MTYFEKVAGSCMDELRKIASKRKHAVSSLGVLGLLGAGAYLGHKAKKVRDDYKMGRSLRQQQGY